MAQAPNLQKFFFKERVKYQKMVAQIYDQAKQLAWHKTGIARSMAFVKQARESEVIYPPVGDGEYALRMHNEGATLHDPDWHGTHFVTPGGVKTADFNASTPSPGAGYFPVSNADGTFSWERAYLGIQEVVIENNLSYVPLYTGYTGNASVGQLGGSIGRLPADWQKYHYFALSEYDEHAPREDARFQIPHSIDTYPWIYGFGGPPPDGRAGTYWKVVLAGPVYDMEIKFGQGSGYGDNNRYKLWGYR